MLLLYEWNIFPKGNMETKPSRASLDSWAELVTGCIHKEGRVITCYLLHLYVCVCACNNLLLSLLLLVVGGIFLLKKIFNIK